MTPLPRPLRKSRRAIGRRACHPRRYPPIDKACGAQARRRHIEGSKHLVCDDHHSATLPAVAIQVFERVVRVILPLLGCAPLAWAILSTKRDILLDTSRPKLDRTIGVNLFPRLYRCLYSAMAGRDVRRSSSLIRMTLKKDFVSDPNDTVITGLPLIC